MIRIKKGDKVVLKTLDQLDEMVKENLGEDGLEIYAESFAGKEFTVSKILNKKPLCFEIEEDEDDDDNYSERFITSIIMGFDCALTKKHHFSEVYLDHAILAEASNDGKSFGWALEKLKNGEKVARKGWNGRGMWIELQEPDAHSKMTLPYLYLNYPDGDKYHDGCRVSWLASQTDLLEEDWIEV